MVKWRKAKVSLIVLAVVVVAAATFGLRERHWLLGLWTSQDVAPGHSLYAEHCAKCHGANLEGQPNWKERLPSGRMPAPPHDATGHTWHHAESDLLLITKKGIEAIVPGYESDMPPFDRVLTDDEIKAILAYIKSIWPQREREYQEARSRAKQ